MASPLLGIAAVNSLLFTAYGVTRRIISPYPDLTMAQIAVAGAGAGAINAVLASPVSRRREDRQTDDREMLLILSTLGRAIQNQDAGPSQCATRLKLNLFSNKPDLSVWRSR